MNQDLFCLAELSNTKIRFRSLERPAPGLLLVMTWGPVQLMLKIIYRISAMNLHGHLWSKTAPSFHEGDCQGQCNSWSLRPWCWAQMSCQFIYDILYKSCIVVLQTGHLLELPGSIWSWQAPPYHDRCRQRERERKKDCIPICEMVMWWYVFIFLEYIFVL